MAGQSFTSTTGAAFLQHFYTPTYTANSAASKASKALQFVKKETNGGGDYYTFLAILDEVAGQSTDYATAASGADGTNTTTIGGQFQVPWCETNTVWRVSGKMIAQTKNNNAAWVSALKFAMDSALRVSAHRRSIDLYSQGWGEVAQINAVSGSTFTCSDASQIYRFYPGQKLVFSADLNQSALRSATALIVTGVDPTNTVGVTLSGTLASVSAVAGDMVFLAGDRQNAAPPARLRPTGFPGWNPDQSSGVTDTTLTILYNVNRALNGRYYGQFVNGTNQSIQDAGIQACQVLTSIGNATDLIMVTSPQNFSTLSKSMGSDRRYVEVKGYGGIGFKTIAIYADGVECPVVSDKYCPNSFSMMFSKMAYVNASIGPAPHINTTDGNSILRQSDDNGIEGRLEAYEVIALKDPPTSCYIKHPTPSPTF